MAAYFNLTLDTTAPDGVTLNINNGALYVATTTVTLQIGCSDSSKTGYTMKIWGVQGATSEAQATWETYSASKQVSLPAGDGLKTVYVKIRDAVYNESTAASKSVTLNTSIPTVTITGPDVNIISKVTGKNTAVLNFTADEIFDEYKVGVVPAGNSGASTCTVIGTSGGSANTSGSAGNYPADTNIQVTIKGSDFETAAGGSDGTYIVKCFVKNKAGTWSA